MIQKKTISRTTKVKKNELVGIALSPAASIYLDFGKEIAALIRAMYQDTRREIEAVFHETPLPNTAMDGSTTSQARIKLNLLTDKWTKKFGALAKFASQRMVDRIVKNSEVTIRMSLKEVAKDLTVDLTGSNAMLDEIIKASTQEAAGLIKRIPEKFLGEVQGQVMRSITTGKGIEDLVPYLTKRYEGDVKWARHVALDQTRKAYTSVNQVRLQALGCESYIWIHSGGSAHPRKEHIEMNGKEYRFDDPPIIDKRTGARGKPGDAIFCLPADSNVEFTHGIKKLFRRPFAGKFSTLVTENNKFLKATSNHPVLTLDGWKPIQDVQVGDYLVKSGLQGIDGFKTNIDRNKATIGQLFDAALSSLKIGRTNVSSSGFEFHGDISNGEIDVIDIDGFLPIELDSRFCKQIIKLIFSRAKEIFDFAGFNSFSSSDQTLFRAFGTPDSVMRCLCSLLYLFRTHRGHADNIRFRLISDFYASINEPKSNDIARNVEFFRNLQFANAGSVETYDFIIGEIFSFAARAFDLGNDVAPSADRFAQIVSGNVHSTGNNFERIPSFQGFERVNDHVVENLSIHVFNLETSRNWFSSDSLIVHNCRCIMKPIFRLEKNAA